MNHRSGRSPFIFFLRGFVAAWCKGFVSWLRRRFQVLLLTFLRIPLFALESHILYGCASMTRLDHIIEATRLRVAEAKRQPQAQLLEELAARHVPRGLRRRLVAMSQAGPAGVAGFERATPSQRLISGEFPVPHAAPPPPENGA